MDVGDSISGMDMSHLIVAPQSSEGGIITDNPQWGFEGISQYETLNESTETVSHSGKRGTPDYLAGKDEEVLTLYEDFSGLAVTKESKVQERDKTKHSKKGQGRVATEKLSNPKNVAILVKKIKERKNGSVVSKQPFAIATNRRLSNDRQLSESITAFDSARPTKMTSATSSDRISQRTGNSIKTASATSARSSEGLRKEAKHIKPLKQGPQAKLEENMHSTSRSTKGDTKARRTGGLSSYGFSFKSDERAQKRKEFNEKLEEKIHAKEVEKTTNQAKTQEARVAEMKMLRKSLMFKANPVPSFYHEPTPPKVKLKKIPLTRPKSPKLGRHKSSLSVNSKENSKDISNSGRSSVDENVVRNHLTKGSSLEHVKKPIHKSLPRLPSEKTTLSNPAKNVKFTSQQPEQLGTDLEQVKAISHAKFG
ncbi:TPX2 domain-containing protein [Cephalotus follicularis]|uniref:TPX2 domain-containing protein n=1 Tax=Cephalotus follicularis TaxID=3775 RepID=A0A1Q3CQU0_CEPFO|nr:TPX2 domain-containing protein [Cephalotus follicularis]